MLSRQTRDYQRWVDSPAYEVMSFYTSRLCINCNKTEEDDDSDNEDNNDDDDDDDDDNDDDDDDGGSNDMKTIGTIYIT
ncbi:hypothetical protein E2C01_006353 [Portunus trituberculatus]|uniref:Uncharacterized protein n=1 Tax=Portunus trituberculatus TaxID=210409 RepID=A0A5B7D1L4_PORTR|nr:hypothetical protein [Portunus trituberculatus]